MLASPLQSYQKLPRFGQQAEPLYRRAIAIREKAAGSDHPGTAALTAVYAALLRKKRVGSRHQAPTTRNRAAALAGGPGGMS